MLTTEESIVLRSQDARGVVTLKLDRPQAFNALSEAMLAELQRDFDAITEDQSVHSITTSAFLLSARR